MKPTDLVILAAAALGIYLFMTRDTANTIQNVGPAINGTSEIYSGASAGQHGYGWRYFSDGTAISPTGQYYLNGVKVYG